MATTSLDPYITTFDRGGITPPEQVTSHPTDGRFSFGRQDGRLLLELENLDSTDHTATFVTPLKAAGLDIADIAVDLPAGETRLCGPFGGVFGNDVNVLADWTDEGQVGIRIYRMPPP